MTRKHAQCMWALFRLMCSDLGSPTNKIAPGVRLQEPYIDCSLHFEVINNPPRSVDHFLEADDTMT